MYKLVCYFKKIIITMMILFICSFIIIEGILIYQGRAQECVGVDVDYVLVLGARLYGSIPSPALEERLNKTVEYLENNPDTITIVCGGRGHNEDITEASAMEMFLVDRGIDNKAIIKEEKSTSTFENIKNARDIIRETDDRDNISALIITSDFHVFRSKLLAERLGFKAYGVGAKTPEVTVLKSYIREYFAVIKSLVFDKE
ncbi:YdcF family protein [Brassicibacter mesophilus]|uniref:YdcF family protein n=1 Tax=Brassicibacter mesophilus TaxID=745119 RepID=UPI003D250B3A